MPPLGWILFWHYFCFPNGPRAGDPSRKTGYSSHANGCSAIFSERATNPCERVGASTARVVKLFERVGASAERVIKPCEQVGASIERVIKPVERVSGSAARVTQAVRTGAMFFKTGNTRVVNGFPFKNGKPLEYVFTWEVTTYCFRYWGKHNVWMMKVFLVQIFLRFSAVSQSYHISLTFWIFTRSRFTQKSVVITNWSNISLT